MIAEAASERDASSGRTVSDGIEPYATSSLLAYKLHMYIHVSSRFVTFTTVNVLHIDIKAATYFAVSNKT